MTGRKVKIGKIILISFIVIVAIIIIAALASGGEKSDSGEKAQESQIEIKQIYHIGDIVTENEVDYCVTNVDYSNGTEFDRPVDGKVFVIVTLQINNHSSETISYNPYNFRMINTQGQIDNETFTTVDSDTSLNYGDLASGGSVAGTIVFEEATEDEGLVFCKYNSFTNESCFEIHLNQ